MKNKYCLPIIKSTESEVLSEIKANEQNYGFFEIWLDYIEDLGADFLLTLLNEYEGRLVFVFRRKNLEKTKLSLEEQISLAKVFEEKNCLVDFDVYNQRGLIQSTINDKLKTIISYHDYKETPSEEKINEVIADIRSCKPQIIKVSTYCKNKTDALVLLKLMLELKSQDEKHIVLGMGEEGVITRIYGSFWGNELTFIPEKKEESSAPGQLTRAEFEKILKEQGIDSGGK